MLKKIAMFAGACAFAMALAAPASAEEGALGTKIANPWTECGIGAMIFPNIAPLAVISNVIWDLGTTAVTSAAASPTTCSGHRAQAALFINKTYNVLASQTAVGSGNYLDALGEVYQCAPDARAQLSTRVRADLADAMAQPGFSDLDRTHKAEVYFNTIDQLVRTEFATTCSAT